jgi:hypothetical protein
MVYIYIYNLQTTVKSLKHYKLLIQIWTVSCEAYTKTQSEVEKFEEPPLHNDHHFVTVNT